MTDDEIAEGLVKRLSEYAKRAQILNEDTRIIKAEFPDIFASPEKQQIAGIKLVKLRKSRTTESDLDLYRLAGRLTRELFAKGQETFRLQDMTALKG